METKILDFLKNPPKDLTERFNNAIYLATETGLSPQLLARYNRNGASARSVEALMYDLQRQANISNVQVAKHEVQIQETVDTDAPVLRTSADLAPVQLDPFQNVLKDMDDEAKNGLRYAQKYSFLKEKDAPKELKAFTVDALNSFDDFKKKHHDLFKALVDVATPQLSNEEVFAIANELLEDFEENRAVHAELKHYEKSRQILGEHEAFADLKLQREIDAVPDAKLGQARNNVASNITKKNNAIADKKNKDRVDELKADLALLEKKRDLFDARIKGDAESAGDTEKVETSETSEATNEDGK